MITHTKKYTLIKPQGLIHIGASHNLEHSYWLPKLPSMEVLAHKKTILVGIPAQPSNWQVDFTVPTDPKQFNVFYLPLYYPPQILILHQDYYIEQKTSYKPLLIQIPTGEFNYKEATLEELYEVHLQSMQL